MSDKTNVQKPPKKRIHLSMYPHAHKRLKILAAMHGTTAGHMACALVKLASYAGHKGAEFQGDFNELLAMALQNAHEGSE